MLSNGLSPLVARKWRLCLHMGRDPESPGSLHMGITMEQIVRFTCRLLPTLVQINFICLGGFKLFD